MESGMGITDLSHARILVTNDDGIHAPGLKVLEDMARSLSDDVWVVSPEIEQSGAGHSLSLSMPIRFRKWEERRFSVSGTPTDCVVTAVRAIVPQDKPISLVLSGVNRGANVADDITHSGTVAAAMEATLCGIPAIAISQYFAFWEPEAVVPWETAQAHVPKLVRTLAAQGWKKGTLLNINIPNCKPDDVKGLKVVPHGRRDTIKELTRVVDPKGRPYYWINWADDAAKTIGEETDLKWLLEHYVTLTPIQLDLTDHGSLESLRAIAF
jgi:5'-nucleotidase